MRKKIFAVIGTVAICICIAFGLNWFLFSRYIQTTDNAFIDGDIVAVSSKVSGQIADIMITDNQRVKVGDILFKIDDADLSAALEQRKASLAAAEAAVKVAHANIAVTENAIIEAEASLKATQAESTRAQADYRRYGKLNKSQFASKQRYQAARATAIAAQSDVERAKAALATQSTRLGLRRAELLQVHANAKAQQASLEAAQLRLNDTVIRAHKDGVVGNVGIRLGQFFSAGQRAMSLVPVRDVYVTANYKETQIKYMQPGQPVTVHVDAYPNASFEGVVDSISPGAGSQFSLLPPENATGNFTKIVQRIPVKIRLSNCHNFALIPGMSVVAEVDTQNAENSEQGPLSIDSAFVQGHKVPKTQESQE